MDINRNAHRIIKSITEENKGESKCSERARRAGLSGGPARARVLTPERRVEIAKKANRARWRK